MTINGTTVILNSDDKVVRHQVFHDDKYHLAISVYGDSIDDSVFKSIDVVEYDDIVYTVYKRAIIRSKDIDGIVDIGVSFIIGTKKQ